MSQTTVQVPSDVQANIDQLVELNPAKISALINLRAGRVPNKSIEADAVINQFNLIESELIEGKKAAAAGDVNQVRDAVCDIVLLAFGQQGVVGGLDLDTDFVRMCAYNMTRIPQTIEEAEATVEKYTALGIQTEIHNIYLDRPDLGIVGYLYPVRCINVEQWDTDGNHYAPNKFVKSVNFKDVEYNTIPDVEIKPTRTAEAKVGAQLTKEMVQAIKKRANEKHGEYGTIPTRLFNQLLDDMVGQRF